MDSEEQDATHPQQEKLVIHEHCRTDNAVDRALQKRAHESQRIFQEAFCKRSFRPRFAINDF